ncbi:MAG: membrane protein insertion efficiency factor YidD [Thermoleophilaceae bacterium]|jgi:putative membrane protein insertion efficiency factor|nr:membrane protein insertion efficiency factor YidD [Thermoleophilaceae bacterium]
MSAPGAHQGVAGGPTALALALLRVYQRVISPLLPVRCKYHPTCSAYAAESIRSFGILKGMVLAGWRLLRCNPWSVGGIDRVEAQRLFRPRSDPATTRPSEK